MKIQLWLTTGYQKEAVLFYNIGGFNLEISMDISKKMARIAYDAMDSKKADDIKVIMIVDVSTIADYFVICSGNSIPHTDAVTDEVERCLALNGYKPKRIEGNRNCGWILLDYGDIVIHIFSKDDRLYYDIERIWRDGKSIEREQLN